MFWLPIIGPILQGLFSTVSSVFNKTQDVKIKEIDSATQVIKATQDDIGVKISRDLLLFPVCLWTALIVWDKIIEIKFPGLVWGVEPLGGALAGLPFATYAFLLGWAWTKRNG